MEFHFHFFFWLHFSFGYIFFCCYRRAIQIKVTTNKKKKIHLNGTKNHLTIINEWWWWWLHSHNLLFILFFVFHCNKQKWNRNLYCRKLEWWCVGGLDWCNECVRVKYGFFQSTWSKIRKFIDSWFLLFSDFIKLINSLFLLFLLLLLFCCYFLSFNRYL